MEKNSSDNSGAIRKLKYNNIDYIYLTNTFMQWCAKGSFIEPEMDSDGEVIDEQNGEFYNSVTIDKSAILEMGLRANSIYGVSKTPTGDPQMWGVSIYSPCGNYVFGTNNEKEAKELFRELREWKYGIALENQTMSPIRFPITTYLN